MEDDTGFSTGYDGRATYALSSSPIKSQYGSDDAVYGSLYSDIFDCNPSLTGYDYESDSDDRRLYQPLLVQDHQDMINCHSRCLQYIRQASKEVDALRSENTHLRALNLELNKHLNLLIHASVPKQFGSPSSVQTTPFGIVNGLRGMRIDDKGAEEEVSDESPTSVIESEGGDENIDVGRFSLPKSISVRSTGYVKVAPIGPSTASRTRPRTAATCSASQKVYVPGEMKEQQPLELDVYNQGMFKTELCNKWQETGACPYGNHCQFAHGIEELRPVIRHPRYKTEVCRMVLAGVPCPYGHRCHFRHNLTENEKLMIPNKPSRSVKLDR